ncbi:hypothetical protein AB0B89_23685 [Sphaerisporangium sp. NPDC049002]|uniref:hypothetical protein n=1 Tax=Sphaerisporangium sp. NPDC049002 TaxID=3155392 RepID=UPI0033DC5F18
MSPLRRLLRHLERRRLEKRWRRAYARWDGRLEVQWPSPTPNGLRYQRTDEDLNATPHTCPCCRRSL